MFLTSATEESPTAIRLMSGIVSSFCEPTPRLIRLSPSPAHADVDKTALKAIIHLTCWIGIQFPHRLHLIQRLFRARFRHCNRQAMDA